MISWHVKYYLSGIVSMIMIRTLRRDIARYNKEDEMVRIAVVVYFVVNSQNLYHSSQAYTIEVLVR